MEKIINISDTVRVEAGPARCRAVATPELLDDKVTATHYKVGAADALGKPIVANQEMDYLDWKGAPVWHIYQIATEVEIDSDGKKVSRTRWRPRGCHTSRDAALVAAAQLPAAKIDPKADRVGC